MPSKTSLFLIGSLALNAALLGIVAGRLVNPGSTAREPTVQMQLERYGPTSDVVAKAWSQLPEDDRKVLRQQFRDRWQALEADRKALSEAGKAVFNAALNEPFEEIVLRDAVTIFQTRERRMQQSAEDVLISHLGRMPPEARATAAVGLLTPFSARMQRSVGEGRELIGPTHEGEKGDGKPDGPRAAGVQAASPEPAPARPN